MPGVANEGLAKGDWPVFHGSYLDIVFLLWIVLIKNVNKLVQPDASAW